MQDVSSDQVSAGEAGGEVLDRMAACAALSQGAPRAAVSVVAAAGVAFAGSFGFAQRVVSRPGSFCEAVVEAGVPLVVVDAAADTRFAAHELVALQGLRSYAGAPIAGPGGGWIGAVGVFGQEPGQFEARGLRDLAALAHMAELVKGGRGEQPQVAAPPAASGGTARGFVGWLGVRTLDASSSGRNGRPGLLVLSVARGSPAARAGLRSTDVLYAADGAALRGQADLAAALRAARPHGTMTVTLRRAGSWVERDVDLRVPIGEHATAARRVPAEKGKTRSTIGLADSVVLT